MLPRTLEREVLQQPSGTMNHKTGLFYSIVEKYIQREGTPGYSFTEVSTELCIIIVGLNRTLWTIPLDRGEQD